MNIFKRLSNKDEDVNARFDLNSWKNLEYNDISIILARMMKEYRESNGLSQKEIADIIGCDKRYIIKLEAGQLDDISFRVLIEIWTKLSTPNYNFGCKLLSEIHNTVATNHEQLCKRRWR